MSASDEIGRTDWVARLAAMRSELAGDPDAPVATAAVPLRERFPLGALAPLDPAHPWRGTRGGWSGAANPAVVGVTFGVGDMVPGLVARVRWLARDSSGTGLVVRGGEKKLPVTAGLIGPWVVDAAQPGIALVAHVHWHESDWIATVMLVNRHTEAVESSWIAGPRIELASIDGDAAFVRRPYATVPGETNWANYDYDPDGVPVCAVAPRVAWGHAGAVELEPASATSPSRLRVELVPTIPEADPASAADGPALGAWVSGPAEALVAELADAALRYARWLTAERGRARDAALPSSPFLAVDALAAEREEVVLGRVREGALRLASSPLALWTLRMAAWVVHARTGLVRWREDQLAFLLAAAPWALGEDAVPALAAARLVPLAPGAAYPAYLGLAVMERAWSLR